MVDKKAAGVVLAATAAVAGLAIASVVTAKGQQPVQVPGQTTLSLALSPEVADVGEVITAIVATTPPVQGFAASLYADGVRVTDFPLTGQDGIASLTIKFDIAGRHILSVSPTV